VEDCKSASITARVVAGGRILDRKGVNLPDTVVELPALTAKDRVRLELGLSLGVDWVALSFVQRPEDLIQAKTLIHGRAELIAKIEKPSALDSLPEIVGEATR
jgi:pyruvate kinase